MTEKRFQYEYDEYSGNLFDNKYDTFYHIEDTEDNIALLCLRLNEQEAEINKLNSSVERMKPFTIESISVTRELNGKYQSALTSIGAFDEFLRDIGNAFNDFEYIGSKDLYELIYGRFKEYCEYELRKVDERYK